MKKLLLVLFIIPLFCNAQDKKDVQKEATKMEQFASKTGVIVKYIDYEFVDIPLSIGVAESKVRKVIRGDEEKYFYMVSKESKYGTKKAAIAYEDLLEVMKALTTLKSTVQSDIGLNPDYLENKFVTDDGFQLGYYVSKNKASWYMQLEKYGSGNTAFIKKVETIEDALNKAKTKIEELKAQ